MSLSCNKGGMTPSEYIRYIDNKTNGLVKDKKIGVFTVDCEYKPSAYIVIKENYKQNPKEVIKNFENENIEASKMFHFYIRLSAENENDVLKNDIQNQEEYFERLNYFSNFVQKDLYLISGSDTIDCAYTYFERNYGLSNKSTILLGFKRSEMNKSNSDQSLTLIYDDQVLGMGPVHFKFSSKDISNIPVLDTNKL